MQNKKEEIDFFNKFVNKETTYDVIAEGGYNRLIKEFVSLTKPKKNDTIADFGCGTGGFTKEIKKLGLKVIGIDISPKCIKLAKKILKTNDFIVSDIENTELKNNSVDIIVLSGVLHHFKKIDKVLKESFRVLKKKGRIFAFDPHKKNPIMWLYRDKKSPFYSTKGITPNERLLEKKELCNVMKKIGFKKIVVKPISGITFRYVESRIGRYFLFLYNIIEKLFEKTGIEKKYGSLLLSYGVKDS